MLGYFPPSIKEETSHIHGIVGDKHVSLHTQLQDGGRAHWVDNTGNERLIFRNFQSTRDIDKLCGKERGEGQRGEREREHSFGNQQVFASACWN